MAQTAKQLADKIEQLTKTAADNPLLPDQTMFNRPKNLVLSPQAQHNNEQIKKLDTIRKQQRYAAGAY